MIIPLLEDKLKVMLENTYSIDNSLVKYLEDTCYFYIRELENCTFTNDEGDTDILMDNNHYKVSVKLFDYTNNVLSSNLMSIDRVRKILQQETNHIIYVFVGYKFDGTNLYTIPNIYIKNIENINWRCLTIQNLGKGQLQMKNNSEPITFTEETNRKEWLNELKKQAIQYYDKMILKITEYKMDWEKD